MSDTWKEIQSVRNKTAGLRDKLAKRKQERQNILDASRNLVAPSSTSTASETPSSLTEVPVKDAVTAIDATQSKEITTELKDGEKSADSHAKKEDVDHKLSPEDLVSLLN